MLVGVYTDTVTWREVLWDAIVAAQYQWNEKKIHPYYHINIFSTVNDNILDQRKPHVLSWEEFWNHQWGQADIRCSFNLVG